MVGTDEKTRASENADGQFDENGYQNAIDRANLLRKLHEYRDEQKRLEGLDLALGEELKRLTNQERGE